jgi:hypothetical protein
MPSRLPFTTRHAALDRVLFHPRMPKTTPVSEKRAAANRANSARSTGSLTPQGKARSAQNSRKRGFAASKFCAIRLEDLDEFAILHKSIGTYQPVNHQEQIAVERIGLFQQSLYRYATLEAGLATAAMNETMSPDGFPANMLTDTLSHGVRPLSTRIALSVSLSASSGSSAAPTPGSISSATTPKPSAFTAAPSKNSSA